MFDWRGALYAAVSGILVVAALLTLCAAVTGCLAEALIAGTVAVVCACILGGTQG